MRAPSDLAAKVLSVYGIAVASSTLNGSSSRRLLPAPPYPNIESRKPAATAEPMTPATFGPIACIRR